MIASAERAMRYVEGMTYNEFIDDDRTIDAVVMNLIVLAEASKGVPEEIRNAHPDIMWQAIAGFRNRAAHAARSVDMSLDLSIVWQICATNLPVILPKLRALAATT